MADPPSVATADDPAPRLLAAYRAAALRMAGVMILNPRLAIEAVGFRRWQGQWLGALITPWCLNVVLTPDDPAAWPALVPGDKRIVRLPAGPYEFVAARDELLGEHHDLSLFSPVTEFEDALAARTAACAALAALLDAGHDEVREPAAAGGPAGSGGTRACRAPLAAQRSGAGAPMSKREFLRGRFASEAEKVVGGRDRCSSVVDQ